MSKRVDEAAAERSNRKRERRGLGKKKIKRTKNTRRKKSSKRSQRVRTLRKQERPSAPPLSDTDSDVEVPILRDIEGIVSSVVQPILRPLRSVMQVPLFSPSTPENSDDEEPPVPLRLDSLSVKPEPLPPSSQPPPVPPRRDAPEPDESTYGKRKKRPARRSSMIAQGRRALQAARQAMALAPEDAERNLTAAELIKLAEEQGFEWNNPFLGLREKTLAAVQYLEKQGLEVKIGQNGWDVIMADGYDSDASTWDAYGPKLRF